MQMKSLPREPLVLPVFAVLAVFILPALFTVLAVLVIIFLAIRFDVVPLWGTHVRSVVCTGRQGRELGKRLRRGAQGARQCAPSSRYHLY